MSKGAGEPILPRPPMSRYVFLLAALVMVQCCNASDLIPIYSGDVTGLDELLHSWRYTMPYNEMTFCCSHSSEICWYILKQEGYDAKIMLRPEHAWVVVRYDDGYVPVETTADYSSTLGEIEFGDYYRTGEMVNDSMEYANLVTASMKLNAAENYSLPVVSDYELKQNVDFLYKKFEGMKSDGDVWSLKW